MTALASGCSAWRTGPKLRELTVRYCFAVDDMDWGGLLELFTDQAEPVRCGRP